MPQDNRKLLTSVAANGVGGAAVAGQHRRNALKHEIAKRVSVCIVQLLEMVDVDQDQGEVMMVPQHSADFLGHPRIERSAVPKPREAVELCSSREQVLIPFGPKS